MQSRSRTLVHTCALLLSGCGGENTASPVVAPGEPESTKTEVPEKTAGVIQDKPPIEALNAYLDGFHFYSGNMHGQMEAHHYCSIVNEEVTQCVIFDGNVAQAKLMGVEYIVSEKLFKQLPSQEKQLWHSHVYEVKSGQLIVPGVGETAEKELMKKLINTYGKTWHTWHTDLHKTLPLGVPQLMMGFTAEGQADPQLVAQRDQRFNVESAKKQESRADLPTPSVDPGADAWQKGKAVQLADPTGTQHGAHTENTEAARPAPAN